MKKHWYKLLLVAIVIAVTVFALSKSHKVNEGNPFGIDTLHSEIK